MTNLNIRNGSGVWLLLMCLKLIICSQSPTKLSSRIVKTKYGQLRGIIIDFVPSNSAYAEYQSELYQQSKLPNETAQSNNENSFSSTFSSKLPDKIQIEAFLGISYAQPPIDDRRFLPPVSPAHWRGIKLADHFKPVCIQKLPKELQKSPTDTGSEFNVFRNNQTESNEQTNSSEDYEQSSYHRLANFLRNQSEDCLHLNIYAPNFNHQNKDKLTRKDKLSVLVFVHGPSYNYGSGNPYSGEFLAWYGELIVITLNYRLGAFGFLPTESDGNVRGNYGLLDLIAALHWIQDNIAQFGGDQNSITLVGHNRGAALVHLAMLSQMSKNLFHRAVLMSGSALSPWAISTQSQYYAKQLADKLNCNGASQNSLNSNDNPAAKDGSNRNSASASIDCLRKLSAEAIVNVDLETAEPLKSSFGPIVDGLLVPIDPSQLVNASQINLGTAFQSNLFRTQSPNFNVLVNKPLLFGVTRVETPPFIFNKMEQQKGISSRRKGEMLRTLVSNMFNYYQEAISLTLINEYTDWSASGSEQNFIDSLIDILGDALVVAPLTNAVNLHLKLTGQKTATKKTSNNNVYSYVFVYQPEMSSLQSARLGCVHGDELAFLFGAPIARHQFDVQLRPFQTNYSRTEVTLSKNLINYWANFAKYSNPNGKDESIKNNQQSTNVFNLSSTNTNLPESTLWPNYDQQHRYLMLGLKSKPRDHYHAHRLSLWLQLIPKLQFQGRFEMEQLKRNIKDESIVFQQQVLNSNLNHNQNSNSLADQSDPSSKSTSSYLNQWLDNLMERLINRILSILHFNNNPSTISNTFEYHFLMTIAQQLNSNTLTNTILSPNASSNARSSSTPYNLIKPHSLSNGLFNTNDYSTALSLIIAIGLILLLLNLFVFLVVYVHRKRKANRTKKDEQKQQTNDLNKLNKHKKIGNKKQSIDSTNLDLSNRTNTNATSSYLPMTSTLTANSMTNAYSANQQTANTIYGPSVQAQHYYYNNVTSNDLNCLTNTNNGTGQTSTLNNTLNSALNNTMNRRGELDFSDYCCSSADEQHLCIYNTANDRAGNNSLLKVQTNNNLNTNNELNRCSANSDATNNSNGQNSTINCLSQNSQLSGISCQCDNCLIHTLNSNSPLTNSIVTGQATLLNANLVNLVNSGLCDSNQCNLTVIHEFEERL